jgi:5'-3' exonuclease
LILRRRLQIHESPLGWLGDIYAYRPAAASENEDLQVAIWRMEEMIDNTLAETGADEFSIFLSGENNFRYDIYPEYKANRTSPKPRHLKDLKQYLIDKYNAQVSDGCEADDLLGIEQCNSTDTVICSLDKDLRMIPGNHYSFEISGTVNGKRWTKAAEHIHITEFDGLRWFYTQVLIGDPADNVKGAAGIGKIKAERLLRDCTNERELFEAARSCFSSDEEFLMIGQCLWIFRKPNDIWRFPTESTISESEGQAPTAMGEGPNP